MEPRKKGNRKWLEVKERSHFYLTRKGGNIALTAFTEKEKKNPPPNVKMGIVTMGVANISGEDSLVISGALCSTIDEFKKTIARNMGYGRLGLLKKQRPYFIYYPMSDVKEHLNQTTAILALDNLLRRIDPKRKNQHQVDSFDFISKFTSNVNRLLEKRKGVTA